MRRDAELKLIVAASQKTGNVWLERLLAHIYHLPVENLAGTGIDKLPSFSTERFVTHQHYLPTDDLLQQAEARGIRFLTAIRHPGAIFVALFHYVNSYAAIWEEMGCVGCCPSHVMIGESIDSPVVFDFMRSGFKSAILKHSIAWLRSGKSLIVRYESLRETPVETLKALTDQIEPVEEYIIQQALDACDIDKMRSINRQMRLHCRKGEAFGWEKELGPEHMSILRHDCAHELDALGYVV